MFDKGINEKNYDKKFQNKLNPNKEYKPDEQFEQYLHDINFKKKEPEEKEDSKHENIQLLCPHCRMPTLKRAPIGFVCGNCGFESNAPIKVVVD